MTCPLGIRHIQCQPSCFRGRCACRETRCNHVVYSRTGKHTPDVCYALEGWIDDADSWYARELERLRDRAPA